MASIADTSKDGLISFSEFQAFEGLLCLPDALYKTAFQLFDRQKSGTVTYSEYSSEFQCFMLLANPIAIPFQMNLLMSYVKLTYMRKYHSNWTAHLYSSILERYKKRPPNEVLDGKILKISFSNHRKNKES